MNHLITLAEAIKLNSAAGREVLSTNESYRKHAHAHGYVLIGRRHVPASKISGKWMVEAEEFAAAVAAELEEQRAIEQADRDYDARKLHPSGHARLSWGSYRVRGAFHFVSSD